MPTLTCTKPGRSPRDPNSLPWLTLAHAWALRSAEFTNLSHVPSCLIDRCYDSVVDLSYSEVTELLSEVPSLWEVA